MCVVQDMYSTYHTQPTEHFLNHADYPPPDNMSEIVQISNLSSLKDI